MTRDSKIVERGVLAPQGFLASGIACGLKTRQGSPDMAMLLSESVATAAGLFTTNHVQAAPVQICRRLLRRARARGVIVNAGNANACTGETGLRDAEEMCRLAALCTGAKAAEFLVASTGIIGRPLPMTKVRAGIRLAAASLGRTSDHDEAFARAIMTTDTVPKTAATTLNLAGRRVTIGGAAKGSGMIAPRLATMLAFITTDCAISAPMLRRALREVARNTFNALTVDGDCSTNDTVLILANGLAGNTPIRKEDASWRAFRDALFSVCRALAMAIARDGEGATRLVTVTVSGARTERAARTVARCIAESPLVKTAIHGGDPNWGRIICAAGYAGPKVAPERMCLCINGVTLFRNGLPTRVGPDRLARCISGQEVSVRLDLGMGRRSATFWTCDLSKEYIAINSEYHT